MENWPNPFENLEPYFLFSFFFCTFFAFLLFMLLYSFGMQMCAPIMNCFSFPLTVGGGGGEIN